MGGVLSIRTTAVAFDPSEPSALSVWAPSPVSVIPVFGIGANVTAVDAHGDRDARRRARPGDVDVARVPAAGSGRTGRSEGDRARRRGQRRGVEVAPLVGAVAAVAGGVAGLGEELHACSGERRTARPRTGRILHQLNALPGAGVVDVVHDLGEDDAAGCPRFGAIAEVPAERHGAAGEVRVDLVDRRRHEVRARRIGDPAADLRPEPLGRRATVRGGEELSGRQVEPLLKPVGVVERHERRHLGRPRLVGELRLWLVRGEVEGRPHVVRVEPRVVFAGEGVDHDAVRGQVGAAGRQRHVRLERPVVRRLDLSCVRVVAAVLAVDRAGEGRGDGEAGGLHRVSCEGREQARGRARGACSAAHRIGQRRRRRSAAAPSGAGGAPTPYIGRP